MGSDHSTLALVHNVDEIEDALKSPRSSSVLIKHGWNSNDKNGNIVVSENGTKVWYIPGNI